MKLVGCTAGPNEWHVEEARINDRVEVDEHPCDVDLVVGRRMAEVLIGVLLVFKPPAFRAPAPKGSATPLFPSRVYWR